MTSACRVRSSYSFGDNSYMGTVSDLCVQSDEFLQFRGQLGPGPAPQRRLQHGGGAHQQRRQLRRGVGVRAPLALHQRNAALPERRGRHGHPQLLQPERRRRLLSRQQGDLRLRQRRDLSAETLGQGCTDDARVDKLVYDITA